MASSPATIASSCAGSSPARRRREHRLDACDQLLGVAGLGDPVVGAAAQGADPVGHRRRAAAHQQRQPGQRSATRSMYSSPVSAGLTISAWSRSAVSWSGAGGVAEHLAVPADRREPPIQARSIRSAVIVDQRDPQSRRRAGLGHWLMSGRWRRARETGTAIRQAAPRAISRRRPPSAHTAPRRPAWPPRGGPSDRAVASGVAHAAGVGQLVLDRPQRRLGGLDLGLQAPLAVGAALGPGLGRRCACGPRRASRRPRLAPLALAPFPAAAAPGRRRRGRWGLGALRPDAHVFGPAADVAVQIPILERDRAGADRVQQRPVVRDEQERAGECAQRRLQRLATLQVEMVGGLVEDQHVGARVDEDRQRQAAALSAGEAVERLLGVLAAEQEPAEQRAGLAWGQPGGALRRLDTVRAVPVFSSSACCER